MQLQPNKIQEISKTYLRGEMDLERERTGLRIGDRLRLRIGDLLGGLRSLLGGDLKHAQFKIFTQ